MAFLFKIQIMGIMKPPVWRKLLVPDSFTFSRFHKVIQAAFGWYDDHVYEFSPSGWGSTPSIGSQFEKYFGDGAEEDSELMKLNEIFRKEKQTFMYVYDFGDDWQHKITLEKITPEKPEIASCIDGKGACPPEDCGGVWGYEDFLTITHNPKDPQYKDMMEWAGLKKGQTWEEVHAFNLEVVNKMVQKI